MPFKKGQTGNPGGRPKGAKARVGDRVENSKKVAEKEFDAISWMIDLANGIVDGQRDFEITIAERTRAASEVLAYTKPRYKSIELTGQNEQPIIFNMITSKDKKKKTKKGG